MKTTNHIAPSGHHHQELIQLLTTCALTCESCSADCFNEADVSMLARCIELNRDCADISFLGAALLQRESEISHEFLLLCERAARLCALECSKHDHEHCRRCTAICQQCADACHEHHGALTLK